MAVKTAQKGKNQSKEFDDSNRGVLFQNDKDGNDSRPDMTGKLAINPDDYEVDNDGLIQIRLAAWQKESNSAGTYLSISASSPQKK